MLYKQRQIHTHTISLITTITTTFPPPHIHMFSYYRIESISVCTNETTITKYKYSYSLNSPRPHSLSRSQDMHKPIPSQNLNRIQMCLRSAKTFKPGFEPTMKVFFFSENNVHFWLIRKSNFCFFPQKAFKTNGLMFGLILEFSYLDKLKSTILPYKIWNNLGVDMIFEKTTKNHFHSYGSCHGEIKVSKSIAIFRHS